MQIGINDLDDDDFGMGFEPSNQEPVEEDTYVSQEPQQTYSSETFQKDEAFLSDFLKTKGINDTSKIKFDDGNGNIEEKDWNSLTKEEKFNILNTPLSYQEDNSSDLSEEEIMLLNQIRQSNLTPSQYIQQIAGEPQEPQYKIDDLSDDELYILDLESRVGELSDEAAVQALTSAKQNEELFQKQVEGIRKEYKEREDFQLQQQENEIEQQQQEAYNQFQDTVINSISQFNSVGNLDLNFDDADRDELAQFMLSRDEAGNNYLWQALQDPDTLVRAAWFILNGEEAFNNVSDYFINQIKLVSQNQYKKGFEEGRSGKNPTRPEVVINNNKNNRKYQSIKDINSLDDDED